MEREEPRWLRKQDPMAPPGWPVIEPGLFMGYFGPLLIMLVGKALSEGSYRTVLTETYRSIDLRRDRPAGILVHYKGSDWFNGLGLREKSARLKEYGQGMKERAHFSRPTAWALLSSSPIARASVRTLFTFAPPGYPYTVSDRQDACLRFINARLKEIDVTKASEAHRYAVERFVPDLLDDLTG